MYISMQQLKNLPNGSLDEQMRLLDLCVAYSQDQLVMSLEFEIDILGILNIYLLAIVSSSTK